LKEEGYGLEERAGGRRGREAARVFEKKRKEIPRTERDGTVEESGRAGKRGGGTGRKKEREEGLL